MLSLALFSSSICCFFVTGDRTCTSMPQHTRLFSSSPGSRQMSAVSHTENTDNNPFYLYPCEDVCHATVSVDLSLLDLRTVLFHFCGLTNTTQGNGTEPDSNEVYKFSKPTFKSASLFLTRAPKLARLSEPITSIDTCTVCRCMCNAFKLTGL